MHTHISISCKGKCINAMILKCYMLTVSIARPCSSASRMWRGCPAPGCLYALRLPSASETGIRRRGPQRKASSLFPYTNIQLTATGSRAQTVHRPLTQYSSRDHSPVLLQWFSATNSTSCRSSKDCFPVLLQGFQTPVGVPGNADPRSHEGQPPGSFSHQLDSYKCFNLQQELQRPFTVPIVLIIIMSNSVIFKRQVVSSF
jgi:hypothetical protein